MIKKISIFMTLLVSLLMPTSCNYDDSDLWNAVDDLDQRVTALEEAVKKLNSQTATFQQILNNKLFIVSVESTEEGHLLHLMSASGEMSSILIKHGANGQDGSGEGSTVAPPSIGVEMGDDGYYYWTIDGDFLLDKDGNKIPVTGKDGLNGKDGEKGKDGVNGADGINGQDGKTPTFKIEGGQWYISFDNGISWTGPYGQAEGKDGDSFFGSVGLTEGGNAVKFTLIDGSSVIVPLYKEFNIAFDVENTLIVSGQSADIPFTITGANKDTFVEVFGKNGWEAEVLQDNYAAGIIRVTAPAEKPGTGRIVVLVSDGADKTIMRTLTFVGGAVEVVSTTSQDVPKEGGVREITVTTNLDFVAEVDEESASWMKIEGTRAYEERTETFNVILDANNTPYSRIGKILLKHEGIVIETIAIVQAPITYARENLVVIVDPSLGNNGTITLPNLNLASGTLSIDWGDGSAKTTASSTLNNVSHTYADTSKTYIVEISGTFKDMKFTDKGVTHIVQWGTSPYTTVQASSSTLVKVATPEKESKATVETVNFKGASSLEYIDPEFFKGMTKLSSMLSVFENCTGLVSLADNMFDDCTKVQNLANMFAGCTKLERAPILGKLGSEVTGNISVNAMFKGCTALKELPENVFSTATKSKLYNMLQWFNGCTSLVSIPDGFFEGIALSPSINHTYRTMNGMFMNCSNLEYLNLDKFFNVTGLAGGNFTNTFYGCVKLQGKIEPYVLKAGNATYNVYPWERETYVNHSDATIKAAATAVFGIGTKTGTTCFYNCSSLDGYTTLIPTTWGGRFDGNAPTEPPTVEVSGTLTTGKEYYSIDFKVKSKNATSMKYLLGSKADYDILLPNYNNDVTKLVDALGSELETQAVNAANASGLTLPFSDADPVTEYRLVIAAINNLGTSYKDFSITTQSVPKGTDAYEAYLGTWRVTSTTSTTEIEGDKGPISFDITIEPYRTNESYMISGWGTTIFRNHPNNKMRFMFEDGNMNAYAGYAGPKSMWNTIASRYYRYTHETYGEQMCDIGMFAYGMTPDGNFSVLLATPNTPILRSAMNSDGTIIMAGGQSTELASYGVSKVYGMDIFINTGGYGWSFTRRPAETVEKEYITTINGVEYGKYALGDYTLTRVPATKSKSTRKQSRGFIKLDI